MNVMMYVIPIIGCLIASAFFSASEMSYSSCNRIRLENAAEEGDSAAKRAVYITDHYDDALSAILVGNNLVNIASSSLGSLLVITLLGESYTWVSTVVLTLMVIVFGETIPKIVAQKNANRLALSFSGLNRFLMTLFRPVTWVVVHLVDLLTKNLKGDGEYDKDEATEELHSIIETAENEDVLDEDSSELISAAIDFADVSVSEVMTARVDIEAIDVESSWEEVMEAAETAQYSRIPVYEDSIDNVIGILSVSRFLKQSLDGNDFDLRSLLMKPCFVYKTMKLPAVLTKLRSTQQHLAVVTDEYGGTLGVVSMEDVLEELVGDIWDETDEVEKDIVARSENLYEIDGDTPVSDLREIMDWDDDEFDFESETVGGWCIEMLDEFPAPGMTFTYKNAAVRILETEERRVVKVRISIIVPEGGDQE